MKRVSCFEKMPNFVIIASVYPTSFSPLPYDKYEAAPMVPMVPMVLLSTESLRSVLLLRGRQTGKDNVSSLSLSLSPSPLFTHSRPGVAVFGQEGEGDAASAKLGKWKSEENQGVQKPISILCIISCSRREIELGSAFLESICLKQSDLSARSDSCPSYVSTVSFVPPMQPRQRRRRP